MREDGHDVFSVSDGGVYESKVTRLQLRRIALPLCRNPLMSYLAARRLAGIVRCEKPDICGRGESVESIYAAVLDT